MDRILNMNLPAYNHDARACSLDSRRSRGLVLQRCRAVINLPSMEMKRMKCLFAASYMFCNLASRELPSRYGNSI